MLVLNSLENKNKFILKLNNKKYYVGLKINTRQLYFFYKLVNNLIVNGKKDKAVNILYTVLLSFYLKNKDPFFYDR